MGKKLGLLFKVMAVGAVLAAGVVLTAPILLKKYLPPEKLRELLVENSRKYLHREVRIKGLDLGALKGLEISGLEISESPDFKAGTFAKADSFQLRVRLLPLLHGTVAIDRVVLGGLRLDIKKGADGLYNFSDISA